MKTYSKLPGEHERDVEVECAVCGEDDTRPLWDCGEFAFVRCRRCGHTYQNPRPDSGDLIDRYDEAYRDYEVENAANFLDLMLKGLADVRFIERAKKLAHRPAFLDIGCATGALLEHLGARGFDARGVEVCEPAARYGIEHRGVRIDVGTIDELTLPEHHFTGIHFSHVIEHVPNPTGFLRRVHELMTSNGLGVVVTPNTAGLQPRIFGSRWRSAIADHVHLFSRRNLVRLLRECGFRVLRTQTWGGLGAGTAAHWLKRPVDTFAKRFGFGDVVLVLFTPDDAHS